MTVDRAEAMNALDLETLTALRDRLAELAGDVGTRVVVLTGAGDRAFIAGADIKYMGGLDVDEAKAWGDLGHEAGRLLETMPKPTARVGGLAYNVELHRLGPPQHRRWLVDYWTPAGQQGPAPSKAAASGSFGPPVQTKAGLGAIWLVLPIGLILALILSVPIVLGIRGWRRRVRADRAYNALPQR